MRKAARDLKKYGSSKLYEALQREAAYASVVARLKKLIPVAIAALLLAPLALAQKLTVVAVSHSKSENDYTIQTPSTQSCNVNGNSVNCTEYNGGNQQKAVYWFTEVVRLYPTGPTYTLRRRAQWVWSNMSDMVDGDMFPAEIKGKHMIITGRLGGNQGKIVKTKWDILDIR